MASKERVTLNVLSQKLDDILNTLARIDKVVNGNGEPEKGLVLKVDRLEQNESRRTRHITALWVAFAAGAMKFIFDLFSLHR